LERLHRILAGRTLLVFRVQCNRPPTAYAAWPMLSLWIEPGYDVKCRLSVVAVEQNRVSAAIAKPEQF